MPLRLKAYKTKTGKLKLTKQSKALFLAKRRGQGKKVKVLSSLNPIPSRQIVRMKYSESFATTVAGGACNYQWNLNSIYQPNAVNAPGVGFSHQPYGRDQMALLYNRYRVIGCKYTVTAYNASSGIRFGTCVANEVKTFTTGSALSENPRAQTRVQYPASGPVRITGYAYLPSVTGRNSTQYMADDRYQAQFDTSPQEQVILNVAGFDLSDLGLTCNWTITLEYLVELFDVKPLIAS